MLTKQPVLVLNYTEELVKKPAMRTTRPKAQKKRRRPKYSDALVRQAGHASHGRRMNLEIDTDAVVLGDRSNTYWVQAWVKVDIHQIYAHLDLCVRDLAQKGARDLFQTVQTMDLQALSIVPTGLAPSFTRPGFPSPRPPSGLRKSK
jgi:hypothetical protein